MVRYLQGHSCKSCKSCKSMVSASLEDAAPLDNEYTFDKAKP